jgi:hypothetical protein
VENKKFQVTLHQLAVYEFLPINIPDLESRPGMFRSSLTLKKNI